MEDSDRILQRIKKMLALANDKGASQGERENAMRMAHKLMAKHNIEMHQVEAAGGKTEGRGKASPYFFGRPWARHVCRSIATLMFCEYIYSMDFKDRKATHHFIGKKSNALTASELSKYLVESIRKESRKEGRKSNFERREFCLGAAHSIRLRAMQIVEEALEEKPQQLEDQKTPGTALVLASLYETEKQKNSELAEELFPKRTKSLAGKSAIGGEAYGRGRKYGEKVSLQNQLKQEK